MSKRVDEDRNETRDFAYQAIVAQPDIPRRPTASASGSRRRCEEARARFKHRARRRVRSVLDDSVGADYAPPHGRYSGVHAPELARLTPRSSCKARRIEMS